MEAAQTIQELDSLISNPMAGLPEDVFLFVSRLTPLLNVDLLISNEKGENLLTWREDGLGPAGWHIPGGIVRFKETLARRILEVAVGELGARVNFNPIPLAMNEVIHPTRMIRGHFLSLLYQCTLLGPLRETQRYREGKPRAGEWAWHKGCPEETIPVHRSLYREFM